MKLTPDLIHAAASEQGGWNAHQLKLLGVAWPPQKGWLSALVGSDIDDATWAKVLALRGVHKVKDRRAILDQSQPDLNLPAPANNFMRSKYQTVQIVRVDMKTELVTVVEPHVLTTAARADEICRRLDQKAGDDLVFHDYCREGTYKDGEQFNGNRR